MTVATWRSEWRAANVPMDVSIVSAGGFRGDSGGHAAKRPLSRGRVPALFCDMLDRSRVSVQGPSLFAQLTFPGPHLL
jgi:hypothetical protein